MRALLGVVWAAFAVLGGCSDSVSLSDAGLAKDASTPGDAATDVGAVDGAMPDAGGVDAAGGLTCPYVGPPLVDPNLLTECTPACGGAHCLPAIYVPTAGQSLLASCSSPYGDGFCVPDTVIASAGNAVPTTCNAVPGAVVEGRCLSDCLPGVAALAASLAVDVCVAGQHCVPCFDPFTGASTGACASNACDAPVQAAYTFPTCCPSNGVDEGTCLPAAVIPAAAQSALQSLTCPANFLCVPDELVPERGVAVQTCGTSAQPAACVSRCLAGVPAILPQGSCSANHACVRCSLAPAGTPGCP